MTPVRSEQGTESAGQHRTLRPAFLSVAPSVDDGKGVLSRGFVRLE